jgi:hypothetical protein
VVLSGNPLQSNWGSASSNISRIKQISAILDSNATAVIDFLVISDGGWGPADIPEAVSTQVICRSICRAQIHHTSSVRHDAVFLCNYDATAI